MLERIKARAKLIRPLIIPLIIYTGLLVFSTKWLESNPESRWGIAVAFLPMIPGIYLGLGVIRAILQLDELERKILLEGIAVSYAITLILVLSFGLLGMAGVPQLNGAYIGLIMLVLWFIGKLWATRRYQ